MEEVEKLKRRLKGSIILIFIIIIFSFLVLILLNRFIIVKEFYKASDFKIKTVYSKIDYNKNGIDDYSDFLLGAKKRIDKNDTYEGLIVKSFKYAGYDFDRMVKEYFADNRIKNKKYNKMSLYKSFINSNAIKLDTDFADISIFQPGDFIFLPDGIAILSDKRNKDGLNFVIYIEDGVVKEKDVIEELKLSGHYRFDSSLIDDELLK